MDAGRELGTAVDAGIASTDGTEIDGARGGGGATALMLGLLVLGARAGGAGGGFAPTGGGGGVESGRGA
ncbi:MAG: hypothetical protein U0165_13705 [Polyangiaceae bacterium]